MATNRTIDIRQYWTNVIRNVGEFDAIATGENPEFNSLTGYLTRLLSDTFVKEATVYGVERWENILGIIPSAGETLEDRKVKILTMLNVKLPYTWRMLDGTIAAFFGEDNYTLTLNNETYTLTLKTSFQSDNQKRDVLGLLNNVVPKNLIINVVEEV